MARLGYQTGDWVLVHGRNARRSFPARVENGLPEGILVRDREGWYWHLVRPGSNFLRVWWYVELRGRAAWRDDRTDAQCETLFLRRPVR